MSYPLMEATRVALESVQEVAEYNKAKGHITGMRDYIFAARTGSGIEDRAWLLYRHHSDCVLPVLLQYGQMDKVALDTRVTWVLKKLLEHIGVYPNIADWSEAMACIRGMALSGSTALQKVNGLLLLEGIANEQDLPLLVRLSRDRTLVTWTSSGKSHAEPLVGFRAVGCIYAVQTEKSRQALESICGDADVDSKVRDYAKTLLARLSKSQH